jgi:PAS domain S-box-containing protein
MERLPDRTETPQPTFITESIQDGDIGRLLASLDFSNSPLGAVEDWSAALKGLMATVLPVKAQIVVFWGAQYVALYNDAYAPSIGLKHPRALGRPAVENWSELWDDLEPLLRGVRETGNTFSATDRPFYIERFGQGETVFFDVSYSAVRASHGSVGGVLCVVTETTERVRFEQRQDFLIRLGRSLPSMYDPQAIESTFLGDLSRELDAATLCLLRPIGTPNIFEGLRQYQGGESQTLRRTQGFSEESIAILQRGESLCLDDTHGSNKFLLQPLGFNAGDQRQATYFPVLTDGKLVSILSAEYEPGRSIQPFEARLTHEALRYAWSRIEYAETEAALRSSSAQLTAIFEQASAGIALCDAEGIFRRVNDRYCQIIGRPREGIVGRTMFDVLRPSGRSAMDSAQSHFLDAAKPFEILEQHLNPEGKSVWMQNHVTPLFGDRYAPDGWLFVCADITARVDAEHQLIELNEGLEARVGTIVAQREEALALLHESRKMEMVGQLGGGIAHDFNNLLTPIITSLELLRRRLEEERSLRLVDAALHAADRARTLVGRLLTFARRQTLSPQTVDLPDLLSNMTELIQRSLGPLIKVDIDVPEVIPPVFIDPQQLELGVLNLAINARDAMFQEGSLRISASISTLVEGEVSGVPAGHFVILTISDDGCGMDEAVLAKCVEPFFSTKGVGQGTGLGLSMVHGLTLQSGGGFSIASKVGKGTDVSLWIPVAEKPLKTSEREPQPQEEQAHQHLHVLLVDDEEAVRYTTALQLRDMGYLVTEASSAATATQLVNSGLHPDVLITDYMMPEQTGIQLAEALRALIADLPVLVVTGYVDKVTPNNELFELLSKPYTRAEIASRLARITHRNDEASVD